MKKVTLFLSLVYVFIFFNSCSENLEDCITSAFKVKVASSNSSSYERNYTTTIPQVLTNDIVVSTGDAIAPYGLNTNGYNLTVLNGDLIINGGVNGASNTIINVYGTFDVSGSVNLNNMHVYCNSAFIFGSMNGGGTIYYCNAISMVGVMNQNQSNPIFQQSNHCNTLSLNELSYEMVEVPCHYLGETIDGYRYIEN
ncbi:hypothetical protein KH5_12040 [Urechidicola sp. KH5]